MDMTAEDLAVLSRFEAVWERVMTGKTSEPDGQGMELETILQELYALRRGYLSLGCAASGRERACLRALAEETKSLFDGLQTEYFLETGDIFLTMESCDFASYTPYNLRKLWKNAIKLAELLQNSSLAAAAPYKDTAESLQCQAGKLKQLLRQSLK